MKRPAYWWSVLRIGPGKWIVGVLALLAVLQNIRAELPEGKQHYLRVVEWLPNWQWSSWAIIGLAVLIASILDGAYRLHAKRDSPPVAAVDWSRLTQRQKTAMSLILSDGNRYKILIYRMPTPDCIRLATDFYESISCSGLHRTNHSPRRGLRSGPACTSRPYATTCQKAKSRTLRN